MDDVWGNAWGDAPSSPAPGSIPWAAKKSENLEEEADLAMPSWSTGAGIRWDEPSEASSSIWSQSASSPPWSPINSYSDISLVSRPTLTSAQDLDEPSLSPEPPATEEDEEPLDTSTPSIRAVALPPGDKSGFADPEPLLEPAAMDSEPATERVPSPSPLPRPPSPDGDGFGMFESGVVDGSTVPWTSTSPVFPDPTDGADAWGSAWGSEKREADGGAEDEDEWAVARKRKEALDRKLSPELLASILQQVEEFCDAALPPPDGAAEEQDWQKSWLRGLDVVENLDELTARYVPDLTLPQLTPFTQSFTGKATVNALKLSRNTPIAQSGPFAFFLAARGSTAWEASVKSRVDVVKDEVPAGWRIMEKKEEEKVEEKAKKTGGLLASLWGRRTSSVPKEAQKVASATKGAGSSVQTNGTSSSRMSTDSVESPSSASKVTSPVSAGPSKTSSSPGPLSQLSQRSQSPSQAQTPGTYGDAGLPSDSHDQSPTPPPDQQTTAVSRFFSRFSRSRTTSAGSARSSLALSGDDLSFLSELVPSADEPGDETLDAAIDPQIRGLESMLASQPIGGKQPPLLPPPPKNMSPQATAAIPAPPKQKGHLTEFDVLDPGPVPLPSASSISRALSPPIAPSSSLPAKSAGRVAMSQVTMSGHPSPSSTPVSFVFPPPPPPSSTPPLIPTPAPAPSQAASLFTPLNPVASASRPTVSSPLAALDDDDFADFLSSPHDENPAMATSALSALSALAPSKPSANDSFGDFDDLLSAPPAPALISPAISTSPTPVPLPPSSPPAIPSPPILARGPSLIASPSLPTSTKPLAQRRRESRAAANPLAASENREKTLNLLDAAASRTGRWPAPLSPIPDPIAPPPGTGPSFVALPRANEFMIRPPPNDAFTVDPPANGPPLAPSPLFDDAIPQTSSLTASHNRTMSLLSNAAARPGRWPAPPSPLAPLISPPPPPPPSFTANTNDAELFDFGTTPPPTPPKPTFPIVLKAGAPSAPASASSVSSLLSPTRLMTISPPPAAPGRPAVLSPSSAASRPSTLASPPLAPGRNATLSLTPLSATAAAPPLLPPLTGARSPPTKSPLPPPVLSALAATQHDRPSSPESTPLALLMQRQPASQPPQPQLHAMSQQPVKGAGGLTAQDLSFFEGL
ncbi:hypothetical protein K488DRAFT_90824 [Vararia minispora EC-137]|uniref:Uncharacterized protein n=1 Tax=Vararia minispora EC-137 TaxID=1314806 RepID=A0ACB8Q6P7_9AGAM|nr:hypothetical protein K488DRAFT_90824 [Vararia minispora EC-137]